MCSLSNGAAVRAANAAATTSSRTLPPQTRPPPPPSKAGPTRKRWKGRREEGRKGEVDRLEMNGPGERGRGVREGAGGGAGA